MHRECEGCGGPIPDGRTIRAMFCSNLCYRRSWAARQKAERLEAKRNRRPCLVCGGAVPTAAPWSRLYCSERCANTVAVAEYRKRRGKRDCTVCGASYIPTREGQRVCSQACRVTAGRVGPRDCTVCGATIPDAMRNQTYCSVTCRNAAAYARRRARRAQPAA